MRKGIWYSVLDGAERGILDLTIRVVDSVKSRVLANQLVLILVKLRDAAKSEFTRHVEGFGVEQMWRLVEVAKGLGCFIAVNWVFDGLAEWIAFTDFNNPVEWRSF